MIRIKKLYNIIKNAVIAFIDDNVISMCASLSFYTIFSLPPLLMIVIALLSILFGKEAIEGKLVHEIQALVGRPIAVQIQDIIRNLKLYNNNGIAAFIGSLVFLFGASGVFSEIQHSLNKIWHIKESKSNGFIQFIQNKLLSFSMIGSVTFLMIVCLIINLLLDLFNERLEFLFKNSTVNIINAVNISVVFVVITILFILIFKTLPGKKLRWKYITVAALTASVLFIVGKYFIGLYLGSSSLISLYGAAGTLIMLLIWVYYSALILYFGAEIAKAYAHSNNDFEI